MLQGCSAVLGLIVASYAVLLSHGRLLMDYWELSCRVGREVYDYAIDLSLMLKYRELVHAMTAGFITAALQLLL
jgi:hypothetical protein